MDPHTIETDRGLRLQADKIILCPGGMSRRLAVPGAELTATHSDAWSLTAVPSSMLVIGGGATGVQVASIFNAFGSRVQLFQAGPRILSTEDEDVSAAVAAAFRESGMRGARELRDDRVVREDAGWRADELREGRRPAAAPRRRSPSWRWAGWPTPPG